MQYNSQCATRRRCPSCMRPTLLRACVVSFLKRAASRFAPCLAAACERYLEWRKPQTFTCHQPARSTTSILIFIARLLPECSLTLQAALLQHDLAPYLNSSDTQSVSSIRNLDN